MMFFFDIKSLYSSSAFSNIAITFLLTLFSRLQAGNSEAALCYVRHMLCAHETQVTSIKQDYDQAESELNVGRSRLKECDSQINRMAKEFHRVLPKRYLSLWYVERKPCTYLTSTLTPSPNGQNVIPHGPRHLGVPSGASKTTFVPMVPSVQTISLSCINISTISKLMRTSLPLIQPHLLHNKVR